MNVATLCHELRQSHVQQWQVIQQHARDASQQQQQQLTRVSQHTEQAVRNLTQATARWNTIMANPSRAGALGESDVFHALSRHFQQLMEVRDSSADTASGDIQLRNFEGSDDRGEVLIEVKMYSNPVPTTEVDKFERDVTQCDLPLAVMCSLTSRITGKRNVELVSTTTGSICLYLSNVSEEQLVLGIEMLQLLHTSQQLSSTSDDTYDAHALDVLVPRLQRGLDSLDTAIRNEQSHFKNMDDCLRKQTLVCDKMRRLLQEHHHRLQHLRVDIHDQFAQDLADADCWRVLTPSLVARSADDIELWIRQKQDDVGMNDSNRLKHSVDIASLVQELVRRGSSLRKTSSGFTSEDTVADSSTAVYAAIVIKKLK